MHLTLCKATNDHRQLSLVIKYTCMKNVIVFLAIFCCLHCNKKSTDVADVPLQGRWDLTDQYTGNPNGGETHESIDLVYYIYSGTDSLYVVYNDVTMAYRLLNVTDTSYQLDGNPNLFKYNITGNKMELKTPCNLGCRLLLSKAN